MVYLFKMITCHLVFVINYIDMVYLFKMISCHFVFVTNYEHNKDVRQISLFQFLIPISGSRNI